MTRFASSDGQNHDIGYCRNPAYRHRLIWLFFSEFAFREAGVLLPGTNVPLDYRRWAQGSLYLAQVCAVTAC